MYNVRNIVCINVLTLYWDRGLLDISCDLFIMFVNVKSLYSVPESDVILYINNILVF